MSKLLDLMQQDQHFRRVSTTNGGEWAGPCVLCGEGKDRMRVWPSQGETGRFWCRRCQRTGDAITYLREWRGLSFPEAARQVGKVLDARPVQRQSPSSLEVLCRYLEEQYAAVHSEYMASEWARRSIERAPVVYSGAERMAEAMRYLRVCQWIEQLLVLAAQVEVAAATAEEHGTHRDRARAA